MNRITMKQLSNLESEANELMVCLAQKESIDEILADIYESGIEGANHVQGMTAAARVIYEVKSFDLDFSLAMENSDIALDQILWRLSHGMNLKERCSFWAAVANTGYVIVLKGMGHDGEADRVIEQTREAEFEWGEVSPELEMQLKDLAKKALQKSGLMMAALTGQIDELEAIDNAKEEARLLLYYTDREAEFRAAAAMLAYVKIKNGLFKNISDEITLPQTAALVCAAIEHVRVNVAVGRGKLPRERAAEILTFLGMYVIGSFLVKLAAEGFEALIPYFGIIRSAAGVLAAVIPLFYLLAQVYGTVEEGCVKLLNFVCAAASDAVRGAGEMLEYMKEEAGAAPEDEAGIREFEKEEERNGEK